MANTKGAKPNARAINQALGGAYRDAKLWITIAAAWIPIFPLVLLILAALYDRQGLEFRDGVVAIVSLVYILGSTLAIWFRTRIGDFLIGAYAFGVANKEDAWKEPLNAAIGIVVIEILIGLFFWLTQPELHTKLFGLLYVVCVIWYLVGFMEGKLRFDWVNFVMKPAKVTAVIIIALLIFFAISKAFGHNLDNAFDKPAEIIPTLQGKLSVPGFLSRNDFGSNSRTIDYPTSIKYFDTGFRVCDHQEVVVDADNNQTYHWLVNVTGGGKEDHLGHPDGVLNSDGLKYRPLDFPPDAQWGFINPQADVGALMLVVVGHGGTILESFQVNNHLSVTPQTCGELALGVNTRRGPGDRNVGSLKVYIALK